MIIEARVPAEARVLYVSGWKWNSIVCSPAGMFIARSVQLTR